MRGETGILTLVIFNCDYVGLVNVVLLVTLLTETNFDQFKLGVGLRLELFQLMKLLGREIFLKEKLPSLFT